MGKEGRERSRDRKKAKKSKRREEESSNSRERSRSSRKKSKKSRTKSQESRIKKTRHSSTSSSSSRERIQRKHNKKQKKKKQKKSIDQLPSIDVLIKEKLSEKGTAAKSTTTKNSTTTEKKSFTPMTKEAYEQQQSIVRKVFDEDTGRMRLVKGDGEILEEIVSASRQKEINRAATLGDGQSFQSNLAASIMFKQ
jgi:hypothetical protein